ncbi:hypothetical protein BDW22DRAFT_674518 [Trametopsis cervina]|nr:hypothetical protein BDW22DRAFT_674518 [Trametopsis cervina]
MARGSPHPVYKEGISSGLRCSRRHCSNECSVLEQAFTVCTTSECICTNVVAVGYRRCMACSISLAQNPSLLQDAQGSMNDFLVNCDSDGFPLSTETVAVGDATLAVPSFTPYTGSVNHFPTQVPPTVTVYPSGSVIIISGGGEISASFNFGSTPVAPSQTLTIQSLQTPVPPISTAGSTTIITFSSQSSASINSGLPTSQSSDARHPCTSSYTLYYLWMLASVVIAILQY